LGEAYSRNPPLDQAQRRIQSTERSYRQNLKKIQQIREAEAKAAHLEARKRRVKDIYQRLRDGRPLYDDDSESGSFSSDEKHVKDVEDPKDKGRE
jgi:uncharacterized coiled-coil DUF342 family protein